MPRPRKPENKGLPARWRHLHGAYYYAVPPGLEPQWDGKKLFRLGATLSAAYRGWAARLETADTAKTIGQLLDRYALEVVPTKAPRTQTENIRYIAALRQVFGDLAIADMKPQLVYRYVDKRSAKIAAHREMEVLSHAFTKAVEWGYIDRHPFKGEVRLPGEKPRDRYVEDWEVLECLALDSRRNKGSVRAIQAYIRIKLMTGMARSDLLRLQPSQHFKEDGIHIQRHKTAGTTGKRTIYDWTSELHTAVDMALIARPVDIAPFLFCTRTGKGYVNEASGESHGWDSMWQRFMDRVLKDTKVTERFTEHDLRAKCASDAPTLEHARALLSHADGRMTERAYRRKPERVKPLSGL
jgi:integrase